MGGEATAEGGEARAGGGGRGWRSRRTIPQQCVGIKILGVEEGALDVASRRIDISTLRLTVSSGRPIVHSSITERSYCIPSAMRVTRSTHQSPRKTEAQRMQLLVFLPLLFDVNDGVNDITTSLLTPAINQMELCSVACVW
jgi:hypothetical protein